VEDLKKILSNFWGGILGGIIALIIACTGMYRIIIGLVLVGMGIWAGNYFQHNKDKVKTNLKKFIDKL